MMTIQLKSKIKVIPVDTVVKLQVLSLDYPNKNNGLTMTSVPYYSKYLPSFTKIISEM